MRKCNFVSTWEDLTDQEQIYMYWEYCSAAPENEQISFAEYAEMMEGFIFE